MKKAIKDLIEKYQSRVNGLRSHLTLPITELMELKMLEGFIYDLKEILEGGNEKKRRYNK